MCISFDTIFGMFGLRLTAHPPYPTLTSKLQGLANALIVNGNRTSGCPKPGHKEKVIFEGKDRIADGDYSFFVYPFPFF